MGRQFKIREKLKRKKRYNQRRKDRVKQTAKAPKKGK
jgi:hypothetical protein